jgi:AraC family transcriptional regulator of adaptative response / DNA-3-methyladenine glycosylase II
VPLDEDLCYRIVTSRDARFDGRFVTAVRTTGIYCRPSCPAVTPRRRNVEFLPTAGAAQQRGYRACLRCLPDAVPGSPDWNCRADLASRAMRLICDGLVERVGVPGLAARLGYSERHLNRVLTAELGAGPLALARAHRAHTARLLIETTALGMAEVAFAAGFASVRQFNDTVRAVYGLPPSTLRATAARRDRPAAPAGAFVLRLPLRPPFDGAGLSAFLGARAVPGVETLDGAGYRRTLTLPHGPATVALVLPGCPPVPADDVAASGRTARPHAGSTAHGAGRTGRHRGATHVVATLRLTDPRDLAPAVARLRRLLDLDADPVAVDAALGADPALAASVAAVAGIRLPGTVDPAETAIRAVLGQRVSVAAARTAAGHLTAALGAPLPRALSPAFCPADAGPSRRAARRPGHGGPGNLEPETDTPPGGADLLFPTPDAIAARGAQVLRGPARRTATIVGLAESLAGGDLVLDAGRDPADLRAELVALPGIGPWTAGYLAMRVLGDPDEPLIGDLAVRRGATELGLPADPAGLARHATAWQPWRSYAVMHLWRAGSTSAQRRSTRIAKETA